LFRTVPAGAAPKSSFMKRVAREGAILIGDMRWNCTQVRLHITWVSLCTLL